MALKDIPKKGKPITPDEVVPWKERIVFPPEVLDAINDVIAKHWNGSQSYFTQDEVVAAIMTATGLERQEVYDRHYVDFEPIYRESGWSVYYDKPAYCESYEPTFTFKKAKSK